VDPNLKKWKRTSIMLAERQAKGNQMEAARLLDISCDALRYRAKKFGLSQAGAEEPPLHPGIRKAEPSNTSGFAGG
jgi:DNA-binding NtrC family response regulator